MPCNDNRQQKRFHRLGAPKGVHTYNHNRGDGAFYQVTGTQNIYHCPQSVAPNAGHGGVIGETTSGEYYDYDEERTSTDSRELEPYRTIADTLSRIRQQVLSFSEHFPSDNTIATICSDAEELVPLVRCVGRTMYQIQQVSPLFFIHPFFSSMESRAFKYDACLKDLGRSLDKFKPCQHPPLGCGPSGDNTCCWPSGLFSINLRECFRRCSIAMSHFLHVLVSSRFFETFDVKDVGLEELITRLSLIWDLHCPTVDTIWVREAAGLGWYSIPLRFCETWKEFAMVMNQYCRKGPEVEYIRQGNWTIVDITDNQTIDQTCFTSILKPDMRFDIGIIVQLLSGTPRTCPQCGHQNRGSTTINGWIHCSNTDCNNSYRIVSNSLPCVLESKSTRLTPHSAGRNTSSLTDASRPSVGKKIWAKLSNILPRTSKPSSRIPLSPSQKEPNSLSGREHPGSSYLNTKFHRILANIPYSLSQDDIKVSNPLRSAPSLDSEESSHSPDGGRGERKNSQSTDPPSPSDRRSVPSDSQEGDTKHPLLTKDVFKRPSGAQVVQRLTKSNNELFVCLSVFGEKYRGKKRFGVSHLHRDERKMYKHVVEQAGIYANTIDTSLGIAQKGIAIFQDVKAILEDPKLELALMVDFIRVKVKEVLDDVTSISGGFRKIRVALYDEMHRVAPDQQPERCSFMGEHEFDLQALIRIGNEDLLQLAIAVLDRFAVIVGYFIDWWSDLRTDVGVLISERKDLAIGARARKRLCDDVEKQYKGYNSEITAQLEYYHETLSDLVVPVSAVNRIGRSARV